MTKTTLTHFIVVFHALSLLVPTVPFPLLSRQVGARSPSFSTCFSPQYGAHARFSSSMLQVVDESEHANAECTYSEAWRIRTQRGHHSAIPLYKHLLSNNVHDSSASSRIAASEHSLGFLDQIGRPYASLPDYIEDIERLRILFQNSHYNHAAMREYVFNLPVGPSTQQPIHDSLEQYKNNYPFGPIYARPLQPGQHLDVQNLLSNSEESWKLSLKCLTILFVLAGCIPKRVFLDTIDGGEETLESLLRLGIVFVHDERDQELIVPLVHLFPIDVPELIDSELIGSSSGGSTRMRQLTVMTDLHPNVLGMTSIPTSMNEEGSEDGAVMYIGPDSLSLVHHLHANFVQYCKPVLNKGTKSDQIKLLDFCTGSGVQALAALAMFELLPTSDKEITNVLAAVVDVNERALRFAELNALLNGYCVKSLKKDEGVHSSIESKMEMCSLHADLVTGEVQSPAKCGNFLVDELLQLGSSGEARFDFVLANPPFIPTPLKAADNRVLSIYGNEHDETKNKLCVDDCSNAPIYGLFSSGGEDGEECLRSIIQMAPSLLDIDGVIAIVSEFMNPPEPGQSERNLCSKIEGWWMQSSNLPSGLLFTNEYAISSDTYARRRALSNDPNDIRLWKKHLEKKNIHHVSPGLLFLRHRTTHQNPTVTHRLVPKTKHGSVWTPQNFEAVEFVRKSLWTR